MTDSHRCQATFRYPRKTGVGSARRHKQDRTPLIKKKERMTNNKKELMASKAYK